jgi:hypothetical protein
MITQLRRWFWAAVVCLSLVTTSDAFALGSDYPPGRPVYGSTNWPAGMCTLVNATNRVWGFFVNQEDILFYTGGASDLTIFLRDYSRLLGIEGHRLVLHAGAGEAKSPWEKTGRPCDWKLYLCPKGWHNLHVLSQKGTNSVEVLRQAAKEPGYIVEVHFWTGGRINLDQLEIPKVVVIQKER